MSATLVERPTVQFTDYTPTYTIPLQSAAGVVCAVCHGYDSGCDQTICRGLDCD